MVKPDIHEVVALIARLENMIADHIHRLKHAISWSHRSSCVAAIRQSLDRLEQWEKVKQEMEDV